MEKFYTIPLQYGLNAQYCTPQTSTVLGIELNVKL